MQINNPYGLPIAGGAKVIGDTSPNAPAVSASPVETPSILPSSALAVNDDRQWAEQQAQKQMDYQERMSNTAYQRAVADMRSAGLNPALAYQQGGASAPVGSIANTGSTSQTAAVVRENNLFKTLNTFVSGLFGLANTALRLK